MGMQSFIQDHGLGEPSSGEKELKRGDLAASVLTDDPSSKIIVTKLDQVSGYGVEMAF
jgi:hypothetical protein